MFVTHHSWTYRSSHHESHLTEVKLHWIILFSLIMQFIIRYCILCIPRRSATNCRAYTDKLVSVRLAACSAWLSACFGIGPQQVVDPGCYYIGIHDRAVGRRRYVWVQLDRSLLACVHVRDEAEAENCITLKPVIGNFTGNRLTDNRFTTLCEMRNAKVQMGTLRNRLRKAT